MLGSLSFLIYNYYESDWERKKYTQNTQSFDRNSSVRIEGEIISVGIFRSLCEKKLRQIFTNYSLIMCLANNERISVPVKFIRAS